MKRLWLGVWFAVLLLCSTALADEAGVLTETELAAWLNQLLLSTANVSPDNAPVGEESLTTDGYAFLYGSATLYYNKPVLDAQSILKAVAVTDEALDMPRGVRLGAPASMLMAAYGWQNPTLAGDESIAPLYVLNQLPSAAYWAWAQRTGATLQSVQCAIHVRAGEDRYTDTGVQYTVQDGVVSAIRVYGLSTLVRLSEVQSNLAAVSGVPTQAAAAPVEGVTLVSSAEPFSASDLTFWRMDFVTLTEKGAGVLFGAAQSDDWAQDDNGQWLHTLGFANATAVFATDANRENPVLESLSITGGDAQGPRGLTIGLRLNDALALFRSDGSGLTTGTAALLYGDGQTAPTATLERTGGDATARYLLALPGDTGAQVALHLTFVNDLLAEIMLYRN